MALKLYTPDIPPVLEGLYFASESCNYIFKYIISLLSFFCSELNAFIHETPFLTYHSSKQSDCSLKIFGNLNQGGYAFSVPKNSAWKQLLSQAVLKLKEQEVIEDLYKKWLPVSCTDNSTNSQYEPVQINYFGGLFFILLLFLLISMCLLGGEHFCYRHHRRLINPIQDKMQVWRETKAAERRNAIINPADISYLQQLHMDGKLGGAARKNSAQSNQSSQSLSEGDISEGEEEMIRMRLGRRKIPRQSTTTSIQRTSLDSLGQYYTMFNSSQQQQQQRRGSRVDTLQITAKKLNFDPELSTTVELSEADLRGRSTSERSDSLASSEDNDHDSEVFPFEKENETDDSLQHLQQHLQHLQNLYHQSQSNLSKESVDNEARCCSGKQKSSHFSKEEEEVEEETKEEYNDSGMDHSLGSGMDHSLGSGYVSSKDGSELNNNCSTTTENLKMNGHVCIQISDSDSEIEIDDDGNNDGNNDKDEEEISRVFRHSNERKILDDSPAKLFSPNIPNSKNRFDTRNGSETGGDQETLSNNPLEGRFTPSSVSSLEAGSHHTRPEDKNDNDVFKSNIVQSDHKQTIINGKKRSRRKTDSKKPIHSIIEMPEFYGDSNSNNDDRDNNNNNNHDKYITNSFVALPRSQVLTKSLSERQSSSTANEIYFRKSKRRGTVPLVHF